MLGVVNGGLVVITSVPDIIVTLATSFVWAGVALLVCPSPGGGARLVHVARLRRLLIDLLPKALSS